MKNNTTLRKDICDEHLFQKTKRQYGELYREHFLEQYKVAIQGIDYTSKWKHIVNNYYLTVNTVLLAAVGLSVSHDKFVLPDGTQQLILVIGIFIAFAWWITLKNDNDVLATKFSILHHLEEQLPISLYKTEWILLKTLYGNPRRAFIDGLVPILFLVFYLLIFLFMA